MSSIPPIPARQINSPFASANLEGEVLAGKWEVLEPISLPATATGGCFSVSYKVRNVHTGEEAFLKVADMKRLEGVQNQMEMMQRLAEEFNFEVSIFNRCLAASRVVDIYDSGSHTIAGLPPILNTASYMVFELAIGDIRTAASEISSHENEFTVLHSVAHALEQIHSLGIAHLDLKPSNVMLFGDSGSKIGDMGCAGLKEHKSPRGEFLIPGDPSYAPPECHEMSLNTLAGFERKKAIDLYLLGSLLFYIFSGQTALSALYESMPDDIEPDVERSLVLELAFARSLHVLKEEESISSLSVKDQDYIVSLARELCHPDPRKRGNTQRAFAIGSQYEARRYVSKFDYLRKRLS